MRMVGWVIVVFSLSGVFFLVWIVVLGIVVLIVSGWFFLVVKEELRRVVMNRNDFKSVCMGGDVLMVGKRVV